MRSVESYHGMQRDGYYGFPYNGRPGYGYGNANGYYGGYNGLPGRNYYGGGGYPAYSSGPYYSGPFDANYYDNGMVNTNGYIEGTGNLYSGVGTALPESLKPSSSEISDTPSPTIPETSPQGTASTMAQAGTVETSTTPPPVTAPLPPPPPPQATATPPPPAPQPQSQATTETVATDPVASPEAASTTEPVPFVTIEDQALEKWSLQSNVGSLQVVVRPKDGTTVGGKLNAIIALCNGHGQVVQEIEKAGNDINSEKANISPQAGKTYFVTVPEAARPGFVQMKNLSGFPIEAKLDILHTVNCIRDGLHSNNLSPSQYGGAPNGYYNNGNIMYNNGMYNHGMYSNGNRINHSGRVGGQYSNFYNYNNNNVRQNSNRLPNLFYNRNNYHSDPSRRNYYHQPFFNNYYSGNYYNY